MAGSIRILIVDDEPAVRDSLRRWFEEDGCAVGTAASGKEALRLLAEAPWDVCLLDVRMPGMDGLELQQRIAQQRPETTIVVMTAYASVDGAVRAMKQGAHDYIAKPFDPEAVERLVRGAVERRRLQRENERLRRAVDQLEPAVEILGEAPAMVEVRRLVDAVAPTESPVRIVGERGTGKEAVARAIHARGPRRYMPFVTLTAAGLSDADVEIELRGAEPAAGATHLRRGALELADGGTLFVADLAALGPRAQATLARALSEKKIRRVGGTAPLPADFRPIVASNDPARPLVEAGRFDRELFDRLSVVVVRLPPLRARPDDVPLLAGHALQRCARRLDRSFDGFTPAALERLRRHAWPGNVRELELTVERAAVLRAGGAIDAAELALEAGFAADAAGGDERTRLCRALDAAGGNLGEAARLLDIDRAALFARLNELGIERGKP